MKTNWTVELLARACNGSVKHRAANPVSGFCKDTRTLKAGEVYIALVGENFDGHKFVNEAIKKKAAGIIISKPVDLPADLPCFVIEVSDCLKALQDCARFYRQRHKGFFIGVTGSNGKTTTRSMLSYLLSLNNKCYATSGNLNNHIGLPLTILHAPEDADFIVLEMGMNHAGEIRELCKIATPDAALINNIGPAHIGMLGSLENISKAKAEIFENLAENAIAVAPDGPEFKNVFVEAAGHRLTTFGMQPSADFHISSLKTEKSALFFSLAAEGQVADCRLNLAGRHNIFNAAAALALYFRLGFELHEGCSALQGFAAVNARMETISIDGISLILDCYNANPGSMSSALDYLASCPPPRIAVLGDMKELGDMSEQYHREMGLQAGKSELELLIAVGAEAKHIATAALENNNVKNSVIALNSNDEAAELLKKRLKTGATVLFKASRGMHFEHIVRKIWPELAEDLH